SVFRKQGRLSVARILVLGGARAATPLNLRCRFLRSYDNEGVTLETDLVVPGRPVLNENDLLFTVPVRGRAAPFLFCSLLAVLTGPVTPDERQNLEQEAQQVSATLPGLQTALRQLPHQAITDAQTRLDQATKDQQDQLKRAGDLLNPEIDRLQQEIAQLTAN